jgi:hypothetical protein
MISMTQVEIPCSKPGSESRPGRVAHYFRHPLGRALVVGAIGIGAIVVWLRGRALWEELNLLQQEVAAADFAAVVGYPEIYPRTRFAQPPGRRFRQDGESVLLWADWVAGKGHRWYRIAPGDLDPARLFEPHQAFLARAIDNPKVETLGGTIWSKMPADVMVFGHVLADRQCVYPLPVLQKVEVINDVVDGQPFLVTMNILSPLDQACSIFDATLDGHRVTLSSSGYFDERKPLLYDRGTESLWIEQADALTAVAGKYKGKQLARVARPVPIAWHTWRLSNPRSRLVIGADRHERAPVD